LTGERTGGVPRAPRLPNYCQRIFSMAAIIENRRHADGANRQRSEDFSRIPDNEKVRPSSICITRWTCASTLLSNQFQAPR